MLEPVENPLGCYEEARFKSREEMLNQIMSVFTRRRSGEKIRDQGDGKDGSDGKD